MPSQHYGSDAINHGSDAINRRLDAISHYGETAYTQDSNVTNKYQLTGVTQTSFASSVALDEIDGLKLRVIELEARLAEQANFNMRLSKQRPLLPTWNLLLNF